jgi:hypothetical protein
MWPAAPVLIEREVDEVIEEHSSAGSDTPQRPQNMGPPASVQTRSNVLSLQESHGNFLSWCLILSSADFRRPQ